MAPRRGGAGGAGAEVALGGSRGYFEPPPLKRQQPWKDDGSNQCDIIAGGVDGSGIFKGIYVSGVHMCALLRTFQLSKAFMPVDNSYPPVVGLGHNLQEGIPIVIVTRGAVGRDLDNGVGPNRNEVQKAVWHAVRQVRADQPNVSITCIDLPVNCSSDVVQACLEPPLNEYRELMYQDGSWYAPSVKDAKSVGTFLAEFKSDRMSSAKKPAGGINFNRKKFGWTDPSRYTPENWVVGWTKVHEAKPAATVPKRTDLKFVDTVKPTAKSIQWKQPGAGEATFQKAVAKGKEAGPKETLAAVSSYLPRANPMFESESLKMAAEACTEAAALFKGNGDEEGAMKALGMAVSTLIMINDVEAAMKVAVGAKETASAADAAKAAKLVMDCHTAVGDLDKALEEAKAAKAKSASAETVRLVVEANLAKGEADAAIAAATEASGSSDKKVQAEGFLLLGQAQVAKSNQTEDKAAYKACLDAAAAAQTKARSLFKDLGLKDKESAACEAAIGSLFANDQNAQALALAKEVGGPTGLQLTALSHVQEFGKTGKFLEGGEDAMLTAAKEAVAGFEAADDVAGRSAAQTTLAKALLAAGGSAEQAQQAAQAAAQGFKSLGQRAGRLSALLVSAQANITRGSIYSAYWDAKQAVVEAEILQDGAGYASASQLLAQASSLSEAKGKKMNVGGPVGIMGEGGETGQLVTYV